MTLNHGSRCIFFGSKEACRPVHVEALVFEGCPHRQAALDLVRDVMRDLGLQPAVVEVSVRDEAEARRLAFLGSPSIRVNGLDIEPSRRKDTAYGLSCRLYGASGVPSREMVKASLDESQNQVDASWTTGCSADSIRGCVESPVVGE